MSIEVEIVKLEKNSGYTDIVICIDDSTDDWCISIPEEEASDLTLGTYKINFEKL